MWCVGKNSEFEINTNSIIAQGSYGKVFDCQCKLQIYPKNLCAKIIMVSKQQKEEVKREEYITQIVQKNEGNKNLVQIYHVEYNKERSCLVIVMEKCISNLDKEQKDKKFYSYREVLEFLRQFLNGYRALFEENIIHRDIKPENILIQQVGNERCYRLADFGLGRIYKYNDFHITRVGTPVFASPELNSLIQDRELDQQFALLKEAKQKSSVDIYSLGIVLHLLVTGNYPFDPNERGILKFFQEIKLTPYKLTQKPPPFINPQIINLIERMLIYSPEKRMTFQSLYEIVNILFQIENPLNKMFIPMPIQPMPNIKPYRPKQQTDIPNLENKDKPYRHPINTIPNPIIQAEKKDQLNQQYKQLINPQLNINEEIKKYLHDMLKIHEMILDSGCLKTIQNFIQGNNKLSEIGKLYNNFDQEKQYNPDQIKFYYCLKHGLQGKSFVNNISYEDQIRDLRK